MSQILPPPIPLHLRILGAKKAAKKAAKASRKANKGYARLLNRLLVDERCEAESLIRDIVLELKSHNSEADRLVYELIMEGRENDV